MSNLAISTKQRRTIVGSAVALLMVAVGAVAASEDGANADSDLPSTTFALFDGNDATFAEFEGKPLVINFWASWCPACVAELPDVQAAALDYGDDIRILGIANADQRDGSLRLAEEVGITYTLADDPSGDLFRELGLFAMPSTIFVTADGQIAEVWGGILTEQALAERIDAIVSPS
jgi:cytochrome c biogenesis protein CcmG/thiol:disulfide interchange protein DsbE